jgi:dienelactone hydrolase
VRLSLVLLLAAAPLAAQDTIPAGLVERPVVVGIRPTALPGTLTLPSGPGPFPGLVLVHGSGPQDRDETIGGSKLFRDLAWGLAANGFAVLRYEKRTRANPYYFVGRRYTIDDETVNDAVLAARLLREQPEIAARRTVVLGHSLGGMFAPVIATRDTMLAGLVIMAGATTSTFADIIERQIAYLAALPPADTAGLGVMRQYLGPAIPLLRKLTAADTATTLMISAAPASYWYSLMSYDMAAASRALRGIPMLVLQGGRDYQLTVADLEAWKAAIGPRPEVTFRVYPLLNHVFVAGPVPSVPSEYAAPGHAAPEVVGDIAAWILALPPAALPH